MSTILALDIGTEFVKAILALPGRKGVLKILGTGKARQAEGGMSAGAITDIPAVVTACEQALSMAEEAAGERASTAVVGMAGELIKGNTTTVNYRRKNPLKPITVEEMNEIIARVQRKAGEVASRAIALESGQSDVEVRLINSAIVSLSIDGYKIVNPVGFKGTEVSLLIYTAFAPMIQVAAIEKVCAELDLDLLTLAVEPFAVCRACLGDADEAGFSGIVIDIGGGTTDVAVIEDDSLDGTRMFNIGGRSFTRQISEVLGADYETAERYKLSLDSGQLDDALETRVESAASRATSVWLAGIEVALDDFNFMSSLPPNIYLCGGGASLAVLQESLAVSDWYKKLPFSRRPIINLIDIDTFPGFILPDSGVDYSFATALGLLRVGVDTLSGAPEENTFRSKIAKILRN